MPAGVVEVRALRTATAVWSDGVQARDDGWVRFQGIGQLMAGEPMSGPSQAGREYGSTSGTEPEQGWRTADGIWLTLVGVSFVFYLIWSESVAHFLQELPRLIHKL